MDETYLTQVRPDKNRTILMHIDAIYIFNRYLLFFHINTRLTTVHQQSALALFIFKQSVT